MKVTVITYCPEEDEPQVVAVLQKATKKNIKAALTSHIVDSDSTTMQLRLKPKSDMIEVRYNYDGEWDEWCEGGCYESTKAEIQ